MRKYCLEALDATVFSVFTKNAATQEQFFMTDTSFIRKVLYIEVPKKETDEKSVCVCKNNFPMIISIHFFFLPNNFIFSNLCSHAPCMCDTHFYHADAFFTEYSTVQ